MQVLFSSQGPLPRWLGLLVGLVLAGLPSMAQTGPGPGFPGGPGPLVLPPVTVTSPPYYVPPPGWGGNYTPYPGWNQPWVGYNPGNAPQPRTTPCPGDILINPQRIAPSRPGNYNGGTFGYTRMNPDGSLKFHDGLDLQATPGTPFPVAYGGVVTRVERSFSPGEYRERSYGNYVEVRSVINGQVVILKYNHMDTVNPEIQPNVTIRAGVSIGQSGTTGNAARAAVPHIHIQARDANGNSTNPEQHLSTKFDHTTGQPTNRPC